MKKHTVHTLVLGSGAAGLAAAVRLFAEGISDICILTEGLNQGTSINTGSDKQTYYKLGMYGDCPDSPREMAQSYLAGGGAHGDLALIESVLSPRAFFHLANLGVPFPHDSLGQYIGYKTDHDPRRRATSCGPYTSREMCRALAREVKRNHLPVHENRVAVKLLTLPDSSYLPLTSNKKDAPTAKERKRVCGLLAINQTTGETEIWQAENLVFAVGGPGGLYDSCVYPAIHTGAIGLALEVGAETTGLPESQFGLASFTDLSGRTLPTPSDQFSSDRNGDTVLDPAPVSLFRWNVSGTFMQVLPRFISTGSDGHSDESEFLRPWFQSTGEMNSRVFLKGYQWPFDVRKIQGSSLIDLIVYYETAVRGRRVFLDFRRNPEGLDFNELDEEPRNYLNNSNALFGTPIERLARMNPGAVELYRDHGIDLESEPLEISVCAQHNNGGLSGNLWYESENIAHLFPIGEVNGSHGVARPGGAALNAGQVGAFRAAEYIANRYREKDLDESAFDRMAEQEQIALERYVECLRRFPFDWEKERALLRKRMSRYAGQFRSASEIRIALKEAWSQFDRLKNPSKESSDSQADTTALNITESLRTLQLCLSHAVYLEAILFQLESGVGSRGSAAVIGESGEPVHKDFPADWRIVPENSEFRRKVLRSSGEFPFFSKGENSSDQKAPQPCWGHYFWEDARALPLTDDWFENIWKEYREKRIFVTVHEDGKTQK